MKLCGVCDVFVPCRGRLHEYGVTIERLTWRDVTHAITDVEALREIEVVHCPGALVQLRLWLATRPGAGEVGMRGTGECVAQLRSFTRQELIEPLANGAILSNSHQAARNSGLVRNHNGRIALLRE